MRLSKRRLIQWSAVVMCNPLLMNFLDGRLYKGVLKNICAPGLNCWSCPATVLACPIGAIQAIGGSMQFNVSLYALGFVLLIGLLIGRAVCGYLCPFGLIQELLYRLPTPKLNLPRGAIYVKYVVLIVFVFALPLVWTNRVGMGSPTFCEYICPAGTLEAGLPMVITHPKFRAVLGNLFALKVTVLLIVLIGSATVERFYCRVLCPLGALYGLMNRISVYRLKFDGAKCVECGRCGRSCPMSIEPTADQNSIECVRCGRCTTICPKRALEFKGDE